jgi:hypothetical protein
MMDYRLPRMIAYLFLADKYYYEADSKKKGVGRQHSDDIATHVWSALADNIGNGLSKWG